MDKLRWGILGTSYFARHKMLPALRQARHVLVSAIASRDLSRAQSVAAQFKIAKAYGSYEELLEASDIDVIYNPLPNHLHVSWSIKALEAGKHVLCEKPVGVSAAEAENLARVALLYPRLKVMEAFMYRFHPQWQHARRLVMDGGVGELRAINSFFSYFNVDAANIRNQSASGGGGLMDIGCYNISLSRFIFDGEPKRVLGIIEYDPKFQTDRIVSGILDFGRGAATFTCSTQLIPYQRVHILGTTGRVEIEIPFNAPADKPCRSWCQRDGEIEEIRFDICNQYALQADQFSLAVLNDTSVPTPLTDALANMKTLEALRESGRLNAWVILPS
jgi:predicted dehydrogenase